MTLAACGSTHPRTNKAATINAALRQLQAEVEQEQPKVVHGDVLGKITLVYSAPPKGISAAEWRAATQKDQALQRLVPAK